MEIPLDKVKYLGLAFATLGLLALLILTPEYRAITPSQAGEGLVGQKVSISGTVRGMFVRNGNAFFSLENNGALNAVLFNAGSRELSVLREHANVQAKGTLSLYKNGFEIIVDRVNGIG